MKLKIAALLTVIVMLSAPVGQIAVGDSIVPETDELSDAIQYGFAPLEAENRLDSQILGREYIQMLSNVIDAIDPALKEEWKKTAAAGVDSDERLLREDGMLATYYAATVLGLGSGTNGDWWSINNRCSEPWDDMSWDYPMFPAYEDTTLFEDVPGRVPGWNYMVSGYFFCMGQYGAADRPLFEVDAETGSMRVSDPFTWREAILASARLFESVHPATEAVLGSEWAESFYQQADQRKESIENHATEIVKGKKLIQGQTYTGNAYYIANDGNDDNDGKSPDTAWASLEKVNKTKFKSGTAVFFQRGDTWYGTLRGKEGVTYSAYGTGPKPCLAGIMDTQAGIPDNWELFQAAGDGQQIWKYKGDLPYVAAIFFDGGYARQRHVNWNGTDAYVDVNGDPVSLEALLYEDLTYTSLPDIRGYQSGDYLPNGHYTGPVYLRCDAGNPADVLGGLIITLEDNGAEACGDNVTFDNLNVSYYGGCGLLSGGDTYSSALVQNCEVSYCGGFINQYNMDDSFNYWTPSITGGAVYLCGKGNSAVGNYIHDCDSKCFIIVYQTEDTVKNRDILMSGNLIDRSGAALYLCNFADYVNTENEYGFKNIQFTDNYVLNTADSWCYDHQTTQFGYNTKNVCSVAIGSHLNNSSGIEITDNVFYLSRGAIIHSDVLSDNMPLFSGNTYVQYQWGKMAEQGEDNYYFTDTATYAKQFVDQVLKDKQTVFPAE